MPGSMGGWFDWRPRAAQRKAEQERAERKRAAKWEAEKRRTMLAHGWTIEGSVD